MGESPLGGDVQKSVRLENKALICYDTSGLHADHVKKETVLSV